MDVQSNPAALTDSELAYKKVVNQARRNRAMAMRKVLVDRFPKAFKPFYAPKIPLQIGIHEHLLARLPDLQRADILNALHDYTHGATYFSALVEGATRIDLNGEPVGVVTKNHALGAALKLRALNLRRRQSSGDASFGPVPTPVCARRRVTPLAHAAPSMC
jgi:ProP effector